MPTDPTTPLAAALRAEFEHPPGRARMDYAIGQFIDMVEAAISRAALVDAGPATEPEGLREAAEAVAVAWAEFAGRVGFYLGPNARTAVDHRAFDAFNAAMTAVRKALTASEPGLDATWREAEAAITRRGTGGTLLLFQTLDRPSNPRPEGERYCAKVTMSGMPEGFFYGPTPAAALRALAASLRSTGPDRD